MSEKSQSRPIVFAETNLIFDCIFDRDANSQYLLGLARQNLIGMSIPHFAFAEAEGQSEVIILRRIEALRVTLANLRDLRRSRYRQVEVNPLIGTITNLINHLETEIYSCKTAIERIEPSCDIIPYNMEIQARARLRGVARKPPFAENDCIIYESILWFAEQNRELDLTMLFITRNRRDFDHPQVHQELGELRIELLFGPGECARRVRELLGLGEAT